MDLPQNREAFLRPAHDTTRMAKKIKKEEKAEAFTFPEFDEADYLREELRDAKAIIAATLLAIPIAAGAAALTANLLEYPTLGILFGLVGFVFIWVLFKVMFKDLTAFKLKHWLMSAGGYFFTFLALWILFINPPFMDLSGPSIEKVAYSIDGGLKWANVTGAPVHLPSGTTYVLRARVTDNNGLGEAPKVSLPSGWSATMDSAQGTDRGYYEATVTGLGRVLITAQDAQGHTTTYSFDTY